MKTWNSESHKIGISQKPNQTFLFSPQMSGFWKVCSFLCPQYLVGLPFQGFHYPEAVKMTRNKSLKYFPLCVMKLYIISLSETTDQKYSTLSQYFIFLRRARMLESGSAWLKHNDSLWWESSLEKLTGDGCSPSHRPRPPLIQERIRKHPGGRRAIIHAFAADSFPGRSPQWMVCKYSRTNR